MIDFHPTDYILYTHISLWSEDHFTYVYIYLDTNIETHAYKKFTSMISLLGVLLLHPTDTAPRSHDEDTRLHFVLCGQQCKWSLQHTAYHKQCINTMSCIHSAFITGRQTKPSVGEHILPQFNALHHFYQQSFVHRKIN